MTDDEITLPGTRLHFPHGGEIEIDSIYKGQVCYRLWYPDIEDPEFYRRPIADFIRCVRRENGCKFR